jgi:glycosyltransferase involved in cell wall biosynthesis
MTNCTREQTRAILGEAYRREKLRPRHGISARSARREARSLLLYDRIFCSRQVVPGLIRLGVTPERIVMTSAAWSNAYLKGDAPSPGAAGPVAFLFVGTVCVRKGMATLLEAWESSGVDGRLRIVGEIRPEMSRLLARYRHLASVEVCSFTDDIGGQYADADVFVFPTFEEGGPKVTYEAAGAGLAVITTRMGAGGIIEDGVNGLIVEAGDARGLASAIKTLAASPETRRRYGARARADAARHTYDQVARDRAHALAQMAGHLAPAPVFRWHVPPSAAGVARPA